MENDSSQTDKQRNEVKERMRKLNNELKLPNEEVEKEDLKIKFQKQYQKY